MNRTFQKIKTEIDEKFAGYRASGEGYTIFLQKTTPHSNTNASKIINQLRKDAKANPSTLSDIITIVEKIWGYENESTVGDVICGSSRLSNVFLENSSFRTTFSSSLTGLAIKHQAFKGNHLPGKESILLYESYLWQSLRLLLENVESKENIALLKIIG